jgi:hypothetical protein
VEKNGLILTTLSCPNPPFVVGMIFIKSGGSAKSVLSTAAFPSFIVKKIARQEKSAGLVSCLNG